MLPCETRHLVRRRFKGVVEMFIERFLVQGALVPVLEGKAEEFDDAAGERPDLRNRLLNILQGHKGDRHTSSQ